MEIACPECGQRLRIPNHLQIAQVRCRSCSYLFTTSSDQGLAEELTSYERDDEPITASLVNSASAHLSAEEMRELLARTKPSLETTTTSPRKWQKSGYWIVVIIAALVTKGPAVAKLFNWKKKNAQAQVAKPARDPAQKRVDPKKNADAKAGAKLGENLDPPGEALLRRNRSMKKEAVPIAQPQVIPPAKDVRPEVPAPPMPSAEAPE